MINNAKIDEIYSNYNNYVALNMDNKLIQLLCTFSKKELNSFGKFVTSPYHNESELLIKSYEYLKKYFPEFNSPELTKENIFRSMYGKQKYNDKKLRDRLSDMLKLAEEFLAIENLKKSPVHFKMQTLYSYNERDLKIHFDKIHNDIRYVLDGIIVKNEKSFYDEYMLEGMRMGFYEHQKLLGRRKPYFEEINSHIKLYMKYFTATLLRYYSIMNNVKGILNVSYDKSLYEPVMNYIEQNNFKQYPLINIFTLMININEDARDVESYYKLKEVYLEHYRQMDEYDKMMVMTELYIHSNVRQRQGLPGFEREQFEIIKMQLEHKAYPLEKGWMKREQFLVTVDMASSAGEIEWAETFIEEYHSKIVPAHRENTFRWAKGFLFHKRKEYEQALNEFAKVNTGDHFYYFRVKQSVSMVYYELGEFENLFLLVDAFKHYIASNPALPEHIKIWNTNYINVLNRLAGLALNYEEYKMDKLIADINGFSLSEIVSKNWLLNRGIELKGRAKK